MLLLVWFHIAKARSCYLRAPPNLVSFILCIILLWLLSLPRYGSQEPTAQCSTGLLFVPCICPFINPQKVHQGSSVMVSFNDLTLVHLILTCLYSGAYMCSFRGRRSVEVQPIWSLLGRSTGAGPPWRSPELEPHVRAYVSYTSYVTLLWDRTAVRAGSIPPLFMF